MTESAWTADELDRIGDADELRIAPRRKNGTLRRAVPIWVVHVGDERYVRSWRGDGGRWYRAAQASREGHVSAGGVDRDVTYVPADDEVNDAVDARTATNTAATRATSSPWWPRRRAPRH